VVGAIAVADREGMPWFGTQSNQTPLAEDLVVASQVYHWEVALADIFTQIEGGVFGGEVYTIDLANGGLIIEFNGCSDLATDELKALAQATVADVIAG
jgi:basic membrane protein A